MYVELILDCHKQGDSLDDIARRIFLVYPSAAFESNRESHFRLFSEIATFFHIPFSSIHVVGSGHVGHSLVSDSPFDPSGSDIDIAVIDATLFRHYTEIAFETSNGFSDRSAFPTDRRGQNTQRQFLKYISRGFYRPDLMPNCPARAEWLNYFDRLSGKYSRLCNGISAGIYASELFFAFKQKKSIGSFLSNRGVA